MSLFDGRTLAGWSSPDLSWWTVEDGAITGRITREHPCSINQYLVWQGGDLADYELVLKSRLSGEGGINNGFQFRSRVLPDGDVAGYQMDNNLQTDWLVRLYDEFGRHTLAWRGKQTVFDSEGKATTTDLPGAGGPAWFSLGDWHEYRLVCRGPSLVLHVDGRLAAQVEDHDRRRADPQGALALQLHSGPPTLVQFKDIRLKILRPAAPAPTRLSRAETRRQAVLASADAWWDFGVGGHMKRHPLRYVGSLDDFEFNVRADGPGARPDARVTLLRGGWFDAGSDLGSTHTALTVWLRARDPQGTWNGALLGHGGPPANAGFQLLATNGVLHGVLHTASGPASFEFPLTTVDPRAWHDFVARYDGRTWELRCDGRVVARRDGVSGGVTGGRTTLALGAESRGGQVANKFRGELEGAGIWFRALGERELRRLVAP